MPTPLYSATCRRCGAHFEGPIIEVYRLALAHPDHGNAPGYLFLRFTQLEPLPEKETATHDRLSR